MITWDLFYTYLKDVKHRKINWEKPRERHNYNVENSRFKALERYFLNKPFNQYTCNEYLATYSEKSNSSKNNALKIVKNVCATLRYYQIENDSVLKPIESIPYWEKKNLRVIEILSISEIRKIAELRLPYAKKRIQTNKRWRAAIYTLALGLRVSELVHLTWADYKVDFFTIPEGKTLQSIREISIPKRLRQMLESLQRYDHNYIFGSHLGKLNDDCLSQELKNRATILGIEKRIHTHIFRHSFIHHSLKNGMPLPDVMTHVGHKDPRVTLQYAHIGREQTKKVVENYELYRTKKQVDYKELMKGRIDMIHDIKKLESIYQLLSI